VLSRDHEPQGWLKVKGRGETGWLHVDEVQSERLLEINFIDVGQGDGAFVVTPDDKFALIDAGVGNNMRRFLSWRFNLKLDHVIESAEPHEVGRTIRFLFAVISHSDLDHYAGFRELFDSPKFRFKNVYHNTLVERPAVSRTQSLGERDTIGGKLCVTELIESAAQMASLLDDVGPEAKTKYVTLLRSAAENGRVERILGVTKESGHLDGFDETFRTRNGRPMRIEILGPVPLSGGGKRGLPWFSNNGQTKNGHSVILRIHYGNVRLLLGGDLNVPAEEHLLAQSVGPAPADDAGEAEWQDYLTRARTAFGADVAKACHHGSSDFTVTFLRAIDAAATVISSGDEESHCHPRPDTLGAVGRHGRGERPLVFSTELARSTREFTKPRAAVQEQIRAAISLLETADAAEREKLKRLIDSLLDTAERNVAVYGMISVRTDGERVVIMQKLERRRSSTGEAFDLQWLVPGPDGELRSAAAP
jgi:beta-lactamase superfamily II metal-dependent hydrolase